MPRGVPKIKTKALEQIETLRAAGVSEEEIGRRMKEVGIPQDKRADLGLPVPAPRAKRETDIEPEADFLKDVSSFLEYAHRELLPIRSKYPDAVANLMTWHRKINRRIVELGVQA